MVVCVVYRCFDPFANCAGTTPNGAGYPPRTRSTRL